MVCLPHTVVVVMAVAVAVVVCEVMEVAGAVVVVVLCLHHKYMDPVTTMHDNNKHDMHVVCTLVVYQQVHKKRTCFVFLLQ